MPSALSRGRSASRPYSSKETEKTSSPPARKTLPVVTSRPVRGSLTVVLLSRRGRKGMSAGGKNSARGVCARTRMRGRMRAVSAPPNLLNLPEVYSIKVYFDGGIADLKPRPA